jgi:hypothetical protein
MAEDLTKCFRCSHRPREYGSPLCSTCAGDDAEFTEYTPERKKITLEELRAKCMQFLQAWKSWGRPTGKYKCHGCFEEIEVPCPRPIDLPEGQKYSVQPHTCYVCGHDCKLRYEVGGAPVVIAD